MYDLIYGLIITSEVKSDVIFQNGAKYSHYSGKWFIDILLSYIVYIPIVSTNVTTHYSVTKPRSGQLYRMVHILAGVASSTLVHIYSLILCSNFNTVHLYSPI
jgi:hypothetical protein